MLFYLLKKKKHKPEKKKAPDARVYLIKKKTTDHHHLHDRSEPLLLDSPHWRCTTCAARNQSNYNNNRTPPFVLLANACDGSR